MSPSAVNPSQCHGQGTQPLTSRLEALLRCGTCVGVLVSTPNGLLCRSCGALVPVRNGVPRFVDRPADEVAARTQASFGYEWTHFHEWETSGEQNFRDYFDHLDLASLANLRVLDAGCGMGRHARQVAAYAGHVVAVDFSDAVDQAFRNVQECPNVDCVQADLTRLPFENEVFDYAYSMGVLHHLADTPQALRGIVQKVRMGGRVRIYLYWKREGFSGVLLRGVDLVRRATTRMPFGLLRAGCWLLSALLMSLVISPYRLLTACGARCHQRWPLFVYSKYPFRILYNDQFDRFSAPIEQRFSRDEVEAMMRAAGLDLVASYPRFGWVAEGTRVR
jgi:SAM-dependent methyltransferase